MGLHVYDRIFKLTADTSMGDVRAVIHAAILNLTSLEDIREFTKTYILQHPTHGRNDIQWVLGMFEIEDRQLWKDAVGDIVAIDVLHNRSEREYYRYITYCNNKKEELTKYTEYYNTNKGQHQSE